MNLRLIRNSTNIDGTFGVLVVDNYPFCVTLELPWLNNEPKISCIPAGDYRVDLTYSTRFKQYMYRLEDVPKRSGILIHAGNDGGGSDADTEGCILLGMGYGIVPGKSQQLGVVSSRMAYNKFMKALEPFPALSIEIVDCF